jgi:hypothetical protein
VTIDYTVSSDDGTSPLKGITSSETAPSFLTGFPGGFWSGWDSYVSPNGKWLIYLAKNGYAIVSSDGQIQYAFSQADFYCRLVGWLDNEHIYCADDSYWPNFAK